ncbi:DUF2382 domain-containing protein [Microcoleus sp. FACHB-831]|uniref:DUF2382 domain-containing protein n=1 Tax=Microcoleus sp. FACHB-831 TaxID=2692827 RepID=UPI0016840451|nr:DUF2382 domain-containing protein [Microcoleus sp. FACHB-831]MBD1923510.1 DUF2382 domain-containing protein [Microcoleus sp. FACHB-831]
MALYKLADFDADYQDSFGGDDIKGYDVYASINDEKIGTVKDIMVDDAGNFRYLVVDTGFWVFGKQVLLPIGRSRIDASNRRVYAVGFTKEQAEQLPELNDDLKIDDDHEEQVRGVYRNSTVEPSADVSPTLASTASTPSVNPLTGTVADRTDSYDYDREPSLYAMNDNDHQTLKLYQERLVANKQRVKTGEVSVGKHIETETTRVSVPVERERVVIERVTPTDAGTAVSPGANVFNQGEVAHVEIYEETPDIHKEAFVREEVRVKKVVDRDTVNAEEQLRREELDVNTNAGDRPGINTPNV